MTAPRVSIVTATYNASHLLRHAIGSVLLQDFEDWELIVVGDCCTDDSEACVASFGDDRIRFVNLPSNSGQQATPNNRGVELARGDFLCFLNQDDLFLPHHLSSNLARLEQTGADLVLSTYADIQVEQPEAIGAGEIVAKGAGHELHGRFEPRTFHVASSWFMPRETAERVGPWRLERETWVTPSQDWLFRAWRRGVRIHCSEAVSLVAIFSSRRPGFFRQRVSPEHDFVFREVIAGDRLRAATQEAVASWIARRRRPRERKPIKRIRRWTRRRFDAGLACIGVHPDSVRLMREHPRRGAYVESLKRVSR